MHVISPTVAIGRMGFLLKKKKKKLWKSIKVSGFPSWLAFQFIQLADGVGDCSAASVAFISATPEQVCFTVNYAGLDTDVGVCAEHRIVVYVLW